MLRGGIAFAAFGALSVAAALPAQADTGEVGYVAANVAEEGSLSAHYTQGGDVHGTNQYLDAFNGEIFAESRTHIHADLMEDELLAAVHFEELRIELTEANVEAMRDAAEDGVSQPGLETPEDASDELVLEASFFDEQIEVAQNWAGEEVFTHTEGSESVEVNEVGAEFSLVTDEELWECSFEGQDYWGATHSLDLVVDFPDEGFSVTYEVGQGWVGADIEPGVPEDDEDDSGDKDEGGKDEEDQGEGDDNGSGGQDGDNGEGQDEGSEGGAAPDDKDSTGESGTESDDLAVTGSSVVGLVAAGAAITAGGGAAAYLARRRKGSADEPAGERTES